VVEAVQSLKQLIEQDFNKKIEVMKAEFQLEFTKLRDHMAEEVTRATAQRAQELSQVRDQPAQVCGELEQTRLQLDTLNKTETSQSLVQTYADAARMTSTSMSSQSSSAARSATPEPVFCTVDPTRVPEDHIGDVTPTMIRKTVEQEMRQSSDHLHWRCVAVTRDGRNASRLRIIGRNEEEIQKIKTILETRKAPGWVKMVPTVWRKGRWPIRSMLWVNKDVEAEQISIEATDMQAGDQFNSIQFNHTSGGRKIN
jgi:hypothetical protein